MRAPGRSRKRELPRYGVLRRRAHGPQGWFRAPWWQRMQGAAGGNQAKSSSI